MIVKITYCHILRNVVAGLALCLNVLCLLPNVHGMAEEQFGPKPDAFAQPDWPVGLVDLLRHPSRVYSIWVNGNETFYFSATPRQIEELIAMYSKSRLRDHMVVVADDAPQRASFKKEKIDYNVTLQVVDGIVLWYGRRQLAEGKDTGLPLTPTLTIYQQSDTTTLDAVKWEDHIVVQDKTSAGKIKSPAQLPERDHYWGGLKFDDGSPASDFVTSMRVRLSLWETDEVAPLRLTSVENTGKFSAQFSVEEMKSLEDGTSFITLTLGNDFTQPTRDDMRFPVERLTKDPEAINPLSISSPEYYWGRLLFEDNTPPDIKPSPWPGAEISIYFPFSGAVVPDQEGYFRVLLTDQQLEELIAQKARKNIYIPSYTNMHHSTALHVFPPGMLHKEKDHAGVLRISKPGGGD